MSMQPSVGPIMQPLPRNVLRGHQNAVNCMSYVSSRHLLSAASDGEIRVWDLEAKKCIDAKMLHLKPIISIHSLAESQVQQPSHFITNSRDGALCLWNLETLSTAVNPAPLLKMIHGMHHFCNATTSNHVPGLIASSAGEENQIWIWDIRSGHRIHCIAPRNKTELAQGMVTCIHFDNSSRGTSLVSGYENGSISIFDVRNYKALGTEIIHTEPVMAIDVNPKEAGIITGSADKSLLYSRMKPIVSQDIKKEEHLLSNAKSSELDMPPQPRARSLLSESLANDANRAISSSCISRSVASIESTVVPESSTDIDQVGSVSIHKKFDFQLPKEGTSAVKFRADGRIIVTGHWDNTVRVFETKSMRPLALLNHHRDSVFSVAFAPASPGNVNTGGLFASASKDGTIALWDLYADKMKS